jgi:hypothetical protein
VSLARASWSITVAACALAALLLGLGGYTGYAIVVGTVGLCAAVNLLPQHRPKPASETVETQTQPER